MVLLPLLLLDLWNLVVLLPFVLLDGLLLVAPALASYHGAFSAAVCVTLLREAPVYLCFVCFVTMMML